MELPSYWKQPGTPAAWPLSSTADPLLLELRICRNVRRDAMKAVDASEKKGDLGEDEAKALSDTVQELTDDYVKQVRAGRRVAEAAWDSLCCSMLNKLPQSA